MSPSGGAAIEAGADRFSFGSWFSFEATPVGWNSLAADGRAAERGWLPTVEQRDARQIEVRSECPEYAVVRSFVLDGSRILITDSITGRAVDDVAVMVRHSVSGDLSDEPLLAGAPGAATGEGRWWLRAVAHRVLRMMGLRGPEVVRDTAENPSLFLTGRSSSLGVVAEDALSRLQATLAAPGRGTASLSVRGFALGPGETRALRLALYPTARRGDYFGFVNAVRRDWHANVPVSGSFRFLDVIAWGRMLADRPALAQWLDRFPVRTVALTPWLDYDNFDPRVGRVLSRPEYGRLMRDATAALKSLRPDLTCLGCMQSNLVTLPEDLAHRLYEVLPPERRRPGIFRFTDAQMVIARSATLPMRDSLLTAADGRFTYELYYGRPQGTPLLAIAVRAERGNAQLANWMDQARFLLDDVGLDGIYIDQFSLAFASDPDQRFSYDRWDGVSIDVDPRTGAIRRRLTDAALAGEPARAAFLDYVLGRGAALVANTHATVGGETGRRMVRFHEVGTLLASARLELGERPPLFRHLCKGHFCTPVALGLPPESVSPSDIVAAVVACLRHGMLYYHIGSSRPPRASESGPFELVNRMFPCTPVELHQGWVLGRERIVTTVSGRFSWPGSRPPQVTRFNASGVRSPAAFDRRRDAGGWGIDLRLDDWAEVAVID